MPIGDLDWRNNCGKITNKKMWYLYLDESGDLGFDFVNKKPSKFFTVAILALSCRDTNRKLIKEVKGVLRRKLNSPLDVYHLISHENYGLQAVDLFCWGVFQKYERKNNEWFNIFEKKVLFDELFL